MISASLAAYKLPKNDNAGVAVKELITFAIKL